MTYEKIILFVYIAYLFLASFISFILFLKDKKKAKNNNAVRIKEKTLLGITVFGGAIGSLIGRLVARHKTNKIYFSFTIYLGLILQIFVLAIMITQII